MSSNNQTYRQILREELEQRCQRNPKYSLRAFARDIKIRPNRLSEIFSEKQGLSRASAQEIAEQIGLSSREKEMFCDLVEAEHGRSSNSRQQAKSRIRKACFPANWVNLDLKTFDYISNWWNLAILELTKVHGFRLSTRWIAGKLGITSLQASLAVEKLQSFNMLKVNPHSQSCEVNTNLVAGEIPSKSIREFHKALLSKAAMAIDEQPLKDRNFNSSILAIYHQDIPEIKKRIETFWQQIQLEFGQPKPNDHKRDSVYALCIQLFRLSNLDEISNVKEKAR